MKKQELIHLHGLLAEVSSFCESSTDTTVDLEAYDSIGVRPASIHQSKTAHKDAVFALAEGITANVSGETVESFASAD